MYMHRNTHATIAPNHSGGKPLQQALHRVGGPRPKRFAPADARFALRLVPLANHRDAAQQSRYRALVSKRRMHTSGGDPQSPRSAPFDIFVAHDR